MGGGLDLQFPHHENEIAQSEGCFGHKHVNYWMHNGFIRVDNEKMSKSLGNFFIIRDVLKEYDAETIRFFILSSHYTSPLNYSTDNLDIASNSVRSLYQSLSNLKVTPEVDININDEYKEMFFGAMNDDFNSPLAISILFKMSHKINILRNEQPELASAIALQMKYLANLLGLLNQEPDNYLHNKTNENDLDELEINDLIEQRNQAKNKKDWKKCDDIRDYLKSNNIILEDMPEGTRWRRG